MGLHQWKKYKVAYNWVWDAEYNEYTNKYQDFIFSTNHGESYSDCKIYQGYIIKNGEFVLTNPKNAEDAVKGDVLYGYFHTTSGGDQYGYDKTYHYNAGIYYTEDRKTLYKFILNNRMSSYSNESYNGDYTHYYLTSDRDASLEGYYNPYKKQTTPKQGSYVGLVQGQEGTYPQNGQKDGFWYVYDKKLNDPPTKPESFILPEKVISRSETEISWTKSTDPENDAISYKFERSLDGGDFVERYKGSFAIYKDIIEDEGHTSVVYRVTAIDSNGNQSESLTSASILVSDNTIPLIETASANLGKITAPFSVSYKVVDSNEGQTWTVTEKLDDKVLKTFTAKVGTSYTSKLSDSDWLKVLNGKHILKIEVVDSEGGKSAKDISFEKAVTKLDFEMEKSRLEPLDKMPERAILSMGASIPSGSSIKVEISNNALDDKPVWQDCTAQVLGNEKIFFSNKEKTAEKWAVNVRVTGDKKTATDVLSVSIIGGFYD